jgi:hypothetical protein
VRVEWREAGVLVGFLLGETVRALVVAGDGMSYGLKRHGRSDVRAREAHGETFRSWIRDCIYGGMI